MITITLPFPPSVNGLFAGGSKQQRFPSKKYKAWLKSCPTLEPSGLDNVSLIYRFWLPDNRERDCQNYIKATADFLVNQGVIVNDSWKNITKEIILPMGIDRENPRVEIEISTEQPAVLTIQCV